jgi:hypothetical protein
MMPVVIADPRVGDPTRYGGGDGHSVEPFLVRARPPPSY